ncbi:hypothetical protein [Sphingomonas sp.]|jgi:hypothetical protein|uniref:hypothetical protein n=1 Tax=Sphingomonas sp. TaxID=28214 RepID=UPI002E3470D0|nr:hypothetical protein [Sphingomonas sp.]HEX4694369.1 hypothetical protein [Sphingomonas sp.]
MSKNAFDSPEGYSGQDYDRDREAAEGVKLPSGTVAARPGDVPPPDDADLPPDAGKRASFDPQTGEVHGSGMGAGGGNPGEDYDSDPAAGDGFPQTGEGSR